MKVVRYSEIFLDTHRSLRLRCRDWSYNITAQNIGGYFYDKPSRTLPVFVNYNKDEDAIAYEDHFVSENHMVALSKTKRKVNSSDADHIFKRTEEDKPTRSTSWAKSTPRATRNRSKLTAVLMSLRSTTDCMCRSKCHLHLSHFVETVLPARILATHY